MKASASRRARIYGTVLGTLGLALAAGAAAGMGLGPGVQAGWRVVAGVAAALVVGAGVAAVWLPRLEAALCAPVGAGGAAAGGGGAGAEALARERNELSAIVEGMAEGVVAADASERVLLMNRAARRLLGVPSLDVVGRPLWEVTRVAEVVEAMRAAVADGLARQGELTMVRSPRDQVYSWQATGILDGAGCTTGAVLVLRDVTELRKLDEVRRDFVANVSHELKTPLTAIHGAVETILDDRGMEEEDRLRFLSMIREQSERLANIVTDLLTLSRIESEEHPLQRQTLDLRDPVSESLQRLRSVAEGRGVALVPDLPPAPVLVFGDREAILEIADNLLGNAIRYNREGGTATVRVARDQEGALLEVADTGIGIEAAHLDRIFERFYRVDKARSRQVGGTGLGLSIVKHLVQAMEGAVSVESAPGVGTTFRVRFPAAGAA